MFSARLPLPSSLLLRLATLVLPGRAAAHDALPGWKYPWACCSMGC